MYGLLNIRYFNEEINLPLSHQGTTERSWGFIRQGIYKKFFYITHFADKYIHNN